MAGFPVEMESAGREKGGRLGQRDSDVKQSMCRNGNGFGKAEKNQNRWQLKRKGKIDL